MRKQDAPGIRGIPEAARGNARDLRQRGTPAERLLWTCLRNRRLAGLKFRRQHPVGPHVLDLFCPEALLAIEIDGEYHDAIKDIDADRTAHLESFGYKVIRFTNEEVLCHPDRVLARIQEEATNRITPPSPKIGRRASIEVPPSPKIGRRAGDEG